MLNKVILVGTIQNDPKFTKFTNGSEIASLVLQTTKKQRTKEGNISFKQWHRVVIRDSFFVRDNKDSLVNGSCICVEGELETRSWQGNGGKQYITEVIVNPFSGSVQLINNLSDSDSGYVGDSRVESRDMSDRGYSSNRNASSRYFDDQSPF